MLILGILLGGTKSRREIHKDSILLEEELY